MKKNFRKYLALLSATTLALAFTAACAPKTPGPSGDDGSHTHTFATAWSHDGEYHWHAATCEHTDEQSDKAVHNFTEHADSEATCTEGGTVTRTCEDCGYTDTVTVPARGHDLVEVAAKAPGCETDGYTAHTACTRCDYKEGYQILPKTGTHRYSTTRWGYDAVSHWRPAICGCDRKGSEAAHSFSSEHVCTDCGYELIEDEAQIKLLSFRQNGNAYTVVGLSEEGKTATALTIPAYYNGKAVTAIEEAAFAEETALVSVVIPETVQTIGSYAFEECTNLQTVVLPSRLTSLGMQVFKDCAALKAIEIPAGITRLEDDMFLRCTSLAEVTVHGKLTYIGKEAFARCASLGTIALPETLTFIGLNAFKGSGLTEITVPESVTTIGAYAFAECASLKRATVLANISYHFGGLFEACSALETLTIPFVGANADAGSSVNTAFGYIFGTTAPKNAEAFTEVEQGGLKYYVPTSLTSVTVLRGSITAGAFNNCSMLQTIVAASGVAVNASSFEGCSATVAAN